MLIWCQTPHHQPTSVAVGARNDHPGEADRPEGTWHSVVEGSGVVVEHIGVDRGWKVGEGGVEAVENRTSRRPEHNPAEEGDDLHKINGLKPTAFAPQVASIYFIWNAASPPVSGSGDKKLTHNEYDVGFELVELHLCLSICLDQEEQRNLLVFESSCHLTACPPHTVVSHCLLSCRTSRREAVTAHSTVDFGSGQSDLASVENFHNPTQWNSSWKSTPYLWHPDLVVVVVDDVAGDHPHQVGPNPTPGLGVEVRQVHAVLRLILQQPTRVGGQQRR